MLEQAKRKLQEYFGYSTFREGQESIIGSVLNGMDTLAIMPTGGGKSICYQIPALLAEGITIVISPLISLMKDQVDALTSAGVSSTYINSSLSARELNERIEELKDNQYKILYIAPERLESASFRSLLFDMNVSIVAIDEAHCISQWGHDFRPSYRSIRNMIEGFRERPIVIALTATATQEVTNDICELLDISPDNTYVTGFARDNLTFNVIKGENKRDYISNYVKANDDQAGIIYAATRREVDELYNYLKKQGIKVGKYHAGMSEHERSEQQDNFLFDKLNVMVATNAFGMGINKSNVRYVIHHNLPKNIEAYYQEAGRAGRDGERSECTLLFAGQDIQLQKFLIEQTALSDEKKIHEYQKLQQMVDLCHTEKCIQSYIIEYFGESAQDCGKCMNCRDTRSKIDITNEALMVFSCIKRMNERFGKTLVAQVLKGSKNKRIIQFGFDKLTTYRLMSNKTEKQITDLIDFLIAEGYLAMTNAQYPVLELTNKARKVLIDKQPVYKKESVTIQAIESNDQLFDRLRQVRRDLASKHNVPPYIIFSDSSLKDMSSKCPTTAEQFLSVKGVAKTKLEKYGDDFISAIKQFLDENHIVNQEHSTESVMEDIKTETDDNKNKVASYLTSYQQFVEGATVSEIAKNRDLTEITVQNHLAKAISEGLPFDWERIFTDEQETLIIEKVYELGTELLKPIKEALPDQITYFQIKATICKLQLNEVKSGG
ncbi:DNA helicase RecQ [Metabacillus malikii]|uniref:DNA helicase RecQ n=1 Tax=Metabacillus malikii TaxID=1504265 RepID=A0ABT9ZGC9_9BACI|nr:DNA helicase RecQ [Metabacillus malikii]MDQ0231340.1 ATP-dependent DNA helicase RecQ [Metabacillus malikii]